MKKSRNQDKQGNPIAEKSFTYALNVIRICKTLFSIQEFVISRQLLKSGTSIGANVEEALGAFSKREFAAKMGIAYKEARESNYWLRLLRASGTLPPETLDSIHQDTRELLRILGSILATIHPYSLRPEHSPQTFKT